MNSHIRFWVRMVGALGILTLVGCSSNKSATETSSSTSEAAPPAVAPEHGEAEEAVVPAGTVSEIWAQIGDEQGKLSAAIEGGQLKDVHHLAFGIRDLTIALTDKASAAAPATAAKLKSVVEEVKTSASKLDELGDAGNLSGTQAEFAKLQTLLTAIRNITGA